MKVIQFLNKIAPALSQANLQSIMNQKVCPRFDYNNPNGYYDQMSQFRSQGYQTYDPSSNNGAWGQMQGQGASNWGQNPSGNAQTGINTGTTGGWSQQNTQGQGWGQTVPQNTQSQGWGQTPQNTQGQGWGQTPFSMGQTPQGQGWGQPAPSQQPLGNQNPQNVGFSNKPRNFGSGVVLKKGQKVNLSNDNQIHEVDIGLGWDAMNGYDLDAQAFMLGANGKVLGDDWFVFYGQTSSPDGAVTHSGDSNGVGDGDDEIIHINLDRVNPQVQKIVFIVTIDQALERGYNFQNVRNAYMRVLNKKNNAELMRFSLSDYYSNVTQMVVGELYRHNGTWKVNPVGDGVAADLAGLCARYGVNVTG